MVVGKNLYVRQVTVIHVSVTRSYRTRILTEEGENYTYKSELSSRISKEKS